MPGLKKGFAAALVAVLLVAIGAGSALAAHFKPTLTNGRVQILPTSDNSHGGARLSDGGFNDFIFAISKTAPIGSTPIPGALRPLGSGLAVLTCFQARAQGRMRLRRTHSWSLRHDCSTGQPCLHAER